MTLTVNRDFYVLPDGEIVGVSNEKIEEGWIGYAYKEEVESKE